MQYKPTVSFRWALTATAEGVSPSRDEAHSTRRSTARRQSHSFYIAVQGGSLAKLNEHNIIVESVAVVTGVPDDRCRANELLCSFIGIDVVLTQTQLNTPK